MSYFLFQADIKNENLMIALEPEAASLYCQFMPVSRFASGAAESQASLAKPGTVYMVTDLGGTLVVISYFAFYLIISCDSVHTCR